MEKQIYPTNSAPTVILSVEGSLYLKGRDENEVDLRTNSSDDLEVEASENTVKATCQGNLEARVPRGAKVIIAEVQGNAEAKALEGGLEFQSVQGSLSLRNVAETKIGSVGGNLTCKHLDGGLEVSQVDGSATLRDIHGAFTVENCVGGNLSLSEIEEGVRACAQGSITARLDPQAGSKYELTADGNLLVRLPEDASVSVDVREVGGSMRIDVDGPEINSLRKAPAQFTLGDGDASLILSADGSLTLAGHAPDWEMSEDFDADISADFSGMAEEISQSVLRQMESQMEMLERQLDSQMKNLSSTLGAVGMSSEEMERVSQRAREASLRATERAQERMQQAQERIRRKMEQVQRKAEQRQQRQQRHAEARERRSWGFSWPSAKAEPPVEPVSEEERLLILKMLEQKQISPEEADRLLSALE